MFSSLQAEIDFIEELRMRRWARENYVPVDHRNHGWHPIVLEEMRHKDREATNDEPAPAYSYARA
jgi:hypothetical protein